LSNTVVNVKQHSTTADRIVAARNFSSRYNLDEINVSIYVGPISDSSAPYFNEFEIVFKPWPLRIFAFDNGVLDYISEPVDCEVDICELIDWINK
jgi:hypothetical protein